MGAPPLSSGGAIAPPPPVSALGPQVAPPPPVGPMAGGYGVPPPVAVPGGGGAFSAGAPAAFGTSPWARAAAAPAPQPQVQMAPPPVPQSLGGPAPVPPPHIQMVPGAPSAPSFGAPPQVSFGAPPGVVAPPPMVPGAVARPPGPMPGAMPGGMPSGIAPPPMIQAPPMMSPGSLSGPAPAMAQSSMPPVLVGFLVTFQNDPTGSFWPIHSGQVQLGRSAGEGVDIALQDASASSRHASIHADPATGQAFVEDDGSRNGTFLNDGRLAAGERRQLRDNDRLRLGSTTFVVKLLVS